MANPYQVTPPPAPRRRSGSNVVAVIVLVVVIIGGYFVMRSQQKDDSKPTASPTASPSTKPTAKDPGSPESSSDTSSSWKVGDCGGPDPSKAPDGYKPTGCSDSGATFKAIDIKEASILPNAVQCPPGTDLMIDVSISYGGKGSGIPTNTVCGRNLSADHPGDAGAGGGQLVKGDCVTSQAKEVACGGSGAQKVLGLVKTKSECPSGTTDPIELTMAIGRPYDVICTDG